MSSPATQFLSDEAHRIQLRRAVLASTVGTTIEWYDFFLYSTVTGLVFGNLFFPRSNPLVGTLEAFTIYAIGFAARPVGAAIFGHYGDRIGRRATLIATLLLMGSATFLVGLVPTYQRIGIWGAVILTILRFLQGVGVGGDWGGSVLLSMEWARSTKHRGFIASWPQFGVPAGLFLANLAVLGFSASSGSQFRNWGWRIPFLLSALLAAPGLYIRLRILETPLFARLVAENKVERAPISEVVKRHLKEIILYSAVPNGRASALLSVYGFYLCVRDCHAKHQSQFPTHRCANGLSFVVHLHSPVRAPLGSHRAQARLCPRRGTYGCIRIYLFRPA